MTLLALAAFFTFAPQAQAQDRAQVHHQELRQTIIRLRAHTNGVLERKCRPIFRVYARWPENLEAAVRVWQRRHPRAHKAKQGVCTPATWLEAVRWAQRAFPGTSSWLLSCSASEGGWGRYVYNLQGSSAQGWLQFMPGTFYGNVGRAVSEARARGLRVPGSVYSIFSPGGQALTGASMYRRGLSSHWVGAGC